MNSRLAAAWAVWLFLAAGGAAYAIQPGEMLADPKLEARARTIDQELRCLVCQNQSIDDSDADLAHDLRLLVRKRVLAGDSDEQVKQYIVARYGNYVLLKPPFEAETYLLWFGPALLLLAAAGTAFVFYRRRAAEKPQPLSAEEAQRLAVLIGDGAEKQD
jgi:cytochrome c-type biogenesis protein CcmH